MKVTLIKELEVYEFGYAVQLSSKFTFPDGYTYYELHALNFITSEFNRFLDDCYIGPLNGKGFLYVFCNESVRAYLVDRLICIKGGTVFLFMSNYGDLQFSLAAKGLAETVMVDIPLEMPSCQKDVEVEMIHQVNYIESKAKKHINTIKNAVYEILCVDIGEMTCNIGDNAHTICQRHIITIDKNTRYTLVNDNERTAFASVVFSTKDPLPIFLLNRVVMADAKIFQHFKNIIKENEERNQFYGDIIISELNILLIEILRSLGNGIVYGYNDVCNFSSAARKGEITKKVLDYLDENMMSGDITVDDIGNKFYLTASYLSRIFKSETGKTISQYRRDKRLEISKKMLLEDNLTVTEVAGLMNYCSIHYFSSEFKKKYGISPSEYANKIK